jgi:hypothetical protein
MNVPQCTRVFVLASLNVVIGLVCLAVGGARAEPTDNWVQEYVVQFPGPDGNPGGAGVYLGKGLVISAAHVVGTTKRPVVVRIDGVNVAARLIKGGKFPDLDLSLISMDERTLPSSLTERRMPLCQEQPPIGAPVILAAPQGITRSSMAPPRPSPPIDQTKKSPFQGGDTVLPPLLTLISDVETSGKSGSGVFDAENKCLLGILSALISNNEHKPFGTYFVPASVIQSFVLSADGTAVGTPANGRPIGSPGSGRGSPENPY